MMADSDGGEQRPIAEFELTRNDVRQRPLARGADGGEVGECESAALLGGDDIPQQSSLVSDPNVPTTEKHRWQQSAAYILVFICAGLVVGVTGPALPWIKAQLPDGANLGHAFALRGLGGLLGSFGGAWALHCGVPGGLIMAAAGIAAAIGVGSFRVCDSVLGMAAGLILLDIGCGFMQVANTLYAWIHPEKHLVGWLNLLNAAFGIGTLTAPAVVALLATLSRSHTQGLLQALLLLPGLVLIVSAGTLFVPSPRPPPQEGSQAAEGGGWRRWAAAILTAAALNGAVGAETTFGAFLVAYVASQRGAGILGVGEREADLMTSAFWLSFTLGRLGSGALSAVLSSRPTAVLWAQVAVMCGGLLAAAAFPSSGGVLWTGAILMGSGVGGLFAAFMGQFNSRYPIDSKTGGLIGVGVMAGVAFWQATAAMCHPREAINVTLAAAALMVVSQCVLQMTVLRQSPK